MHNERLDETNYILYAAKNYDSKCSSTVEFYDDLSRFKYIKRLFSRYLESGDLKERLILNHLIILYNVFGVPAATRLLFLKMEDFLPQLKPFLTMMGYLPETVEKIGLSEYTYYTVDIPLDQKIVDVLRKI
jgi:hypothetical protein